MSSSREVLSSASETPPLLPEGEKNRFTLELGKVRSSGIVLTIGFVENPGSVIKVILPTGGDGESPPSLAGYRLEVTLVGPLGQPTKPKLST